MHPQEAQAAGNQNAISNTENALRGTDAGCVVPSWIPRRPPRRWVAPAVVRRLLPLCLLLLAVACGGDGDSPTEVNSAPEILQITLEKLAVAQGEDIWISCDAEDAEDDPLTYVWSADVGEFLGDTDVADVSWRAPDDYQGTATITIVVTDGSRESDPRHVAIDILAESGTLTGTVTRTGSSDAIESVTVAIGQLSGETGADGTYTIEAIPIGTYDATASLAGYVTVTRSIEIKDGPNELNFTLTPEEDMGTLSGEVTNSRGEPVVGALCRISSRDLETETDSNGRYSLGPTSQGTFNLQITRPGYVFYSTTQELTQTEQTLDARLTTAVPGSVSNVVATRSGTTMTVSWDRPESDTIDGYHLYWNIDATTTEEVPGGLLGGEATSFSIEGVEDHLYRFIVFAIDIEGREGGANGISNAVVLTELSSLVDVPAGQVIMGEWVPGEDAEQTQPHVGNPVSVGAFQIEANEVTNQQFYTFLWEATSSGFADISGTDVLLDGNKLITFGLSKIKLEGNVFTLPEEYRAHPAAGITWFGAEAYARFYGRRLPSEAEWERAARGSSAASGTYGSTGVGYGTRYPWGNETPTISLANFGGLIGRTRAVRSLPAGATVHWDAPIYEMAGNVWEWCQDWFGTYANPHSPPATGTQRVLRGGSHHDDAEWLSTWARFKQEPGITSSYTGFRCAN
ncbi:MAG: SUMF1/EgtB/PvdO family nonheme iron enzyme [Candidatus Eisenbacteria bacterium]